MEPLRQLVQKIHGLLEVGIRMEGIKMTNSSFDTHRNQIFGFGSIPINIVMQPE